MASLYRVELPTGVRLGPMSSTALRELVASGVVTADCKVNREGSDRWVLASTVHGLEFATPAAAPPPPVAPAPPPPPAPEPPPPSAIPESRMDFDEPGLPPDFADEPIPPALSSDDDPHEEHSSPFESTEPEDTPMEHATSTPSPAPARPAEPDHRYFKSVVPSCFDLLLDPVAYVPRLYAGYPASFVRLFSWTIVAALHTILVIWFVESDAARMGDILDSIIRGIVVAVATAISMAILSLGVRWLADSKAQLSFAYDALTAAAVLFPIYLGNFAKLLAESPRTQNAAEIAGLVVGGIVFYSLMERTGTSSKPRTALLTVLAMLVLAFVGHKFYITFAPSLVEIWVY